MVGEAREERGRGGAWTGPPLRLRERRSRKSQARAQILHREGHQIRERELIRSIDEVSEPFPILYFVLRGSILSNVVVVKLLFLDCF